MPRRKPIESSNVAGSTMEVEIGAQRAGHMLVTRVTGQSDGITVASTIDGDQLPDRHYLVPRRQEGELLAETIEDAGAHPITAEALAMAAAIVGRPVPGSRAGTPAA